MKKGRGERERKRTRSSSQLKFPGSTRPDGRVFGLEGVQLNMLVKVSQSAFRASPSTADLFHESANNIPISSEGICFA